MNGACFIGVDVDATRIEKIVPTLEAIIAKGGKPVLLDAYCAHMGTHLTASTSASVVRSRRAGASLSYKREYDRLSDLFGGKKRKKTKKLDD